MKLLFTSVGRRVELLQAFRDAAKRTDIPLTLCGADISETAPALFFCDERYIVPRINSGDYIPALLEICKREGITALVPTIDTDLLILAQNKGRFAEIGTTVVISDSEKIRVCRDKRLTSTFFVECGLRAPMTFDDVDKYDMGFPAFIKPKDGSSSINAFKVENEAELRSYASQIDDHIIQPFIEGTEYTVDIFCDLEGSPVFITPRIRLAVRSGEVLKTEIRKDESIIAEMLSFIEKYKPCGAVTVQLIQNNTTGENWYIEINPRFGGGAPLSMKAGADAAAALLRILNGENLDYCHDGAEDGATFSRFDQSVRVK